MSYIGSFAFVIVALSSLWTGVMDAAKDDMILRLQMTELMAKSVYELTMVSVI